MGRLDTIRKSSPWRSLDLDIEVARAGMPLTLPGMPPRTVDILLEIRARAAEKQEAQKGLELNIRDIPWPLAERSTLQVTPGVLLSSDFFFLWENMCHAMSCQRQLPTRWELGWAGNVVQPHENNLFHCADCSREVFDPWHFPQVRIAPLGMLWGLGVGSFSWLFLRLAKWSSVVPVVFSCQTHVEMKIVDLLAPCHPKA